MQELKKGDPAYLVAFYNSEFRALAKVRITYVFIVNYKLMIDEVFYDNVYGLTPTLPKTGLEWSKDKVYRENELGKIKSKKKQKMIKAFFVSPEYIGGTS